MHRQSSSAWTFAKSWPRRRSNEQPPRSFGGAHTEQWPGCHRSPRWPLQGGQMFSCQEQPGTCQSCVVRTSVVFGNGLQREDVSADESEC
jgi:hypothetical protein